MKCKFLRVTGFVVCILMSVFLAGCNGSGEQASKVENIKVWTNDAHSKELITQMVSNYNNTTGKAEGIQIEYTVHGDNFNQVLEMAIANGNAPEMFKAAGSLRTLVQKGILMPLEELPDMDEFLNGYGNAIIPEINSVDGSTYRIPFATTTLGLVYNKDLFKAAGIVDGNGDALPPKTWDELREYAKRLTDPDKKVYGIALPVKWGDFFSWGLITPFRASIKITEYNQQESKYDYTVIKPAFEWLLGVKADKSFFPGAEGLDNDMARAQFAEQRVAMIMGASWDVGVYNEQFIAKCDWGVAPVPVVNPDNCFKQNAVANSLLSVSSDIGNVNPEKIAKVYKWFSSEEFLTKMYESGKYIPYSDEIIKKANPDSSIKGWAEFANLMKISSIQPSAPVIKLEGSTVVETYSKIWAEAISIDEGLSDLSKRSNEALQKGISDGTIDMSLYPKVLPDRDR